MPVIAVVGAGLGGTLAAFEIKEAVKDRASVIVISKGDIFHFVPSNPWVAVHWRTRDAIEINLAPIMERKGIGFNGAGAKRIVPAENRIELCTDSSVLYDYLVVATGPELAFDEVEGLGPTGFTQSICHVDHAERAAAAFDAFVLSPGPVVFGAVQGASCFGPAYEFALIFETECRRRKLRDRVPITFVTSEPYIGHLGLDGVGDTKGLLESEFRKRHIKWITNARVDRVRDGTMDVSEISEDGSVKVRHELPFSYSMMLPAFRGVEAVRHTDGLANPRGFVVVDKYQRNPTFKNIFGLGVCIAIAPTGKTAVPVGVPKTGFMIESMVTAIAHNIVELLQGREPSHEAAWNAICLADFGDGGVAFFAQPQIPPRNVSWSASGKWVHAAKVGFEKYFLAKIRQGTSQPFYERFLLTLIGAEKLKS
jgi:sulfide:quinone oxidoreductase